MRAVTVIVGYALQEAIRRKMFALVIVLTGGFLALYWYGTSKLFDDLSGVGPPPAGISVETFAGATVLGLAMFATLFLGAVLAVFLTLNVVRGDAERGLLQPLVVRPLGRGTLLLARFIASAGVCAVYVGLVYAATVLITWSNGHWVPDRVVLPGLELAVAVAVIAGLSLLGSVYLSATANGIGVLMLFGAGLVAGILNEIGQALNSHTLKTIGSIAAYVTPFEALYQDGLAQLTADQTGLTKFVLQLGPAGGARAGGTHLVWWTCVYFALLAAAAVGGFARRDL
jgi:Cu-processing system permease protein